MTANKKTPPKADAQAPAAPQEPAPNLATALLRAQRAVQPVGKTSWNDQHRYAYASSEAILAAAKDALNAQDLLPLTVNQTLETVAEPTDWGKNRHGLDLVCDFRLVHAPSGEEVDFEGWRLPIVANGGRPPDKATLASLTELRAYWLSHVLGLIREDADDVSGRKDEEGARGRPANRPQGRTQVPPEVAEARRYLTTVYDGGTHRDVLLDCHRELYGSRAPDSLTGEEAVALASAVHDAIGNLPAWDAAKAPGGPDPRPMTDPGDQPEDHDERDLGRKD